MRVDENSYGGTEVDNILSLMEGAATLYRAKRYEEALNFYEKVIQIEPNYSDAYVGKGDCLRKLKDYYNAISAYERAIQLNLKNVSAYNGMCYACAKLRHYDNALLMHLKAIKIDPENATAYNGKGIIFRLQGGYEEALQAFEEAIRLSRHEDNLAGFYYNKGLTLCDLNRYEEALEAYEYAMQLEPGRKKYLDERTRIFHELSSSQLTTHEQLKSISKNEQAKNISKFFDDGESLYRLQRYKESLEAFDKALRIDPAYTPAQLRRGNIFLELKQYWTALRVFDTILQLQANHAHALVGKGNALLRLKYYEEALLAFDNALQLNSKLVQAYASKGHALFALLRSMDALKAYETAIELNTSDVDCYKNAGDILISLGPEYYERAAQLYERALHVAPEDVSTYLAQGNALFELKRYDESLVAYKHVITLDKSNVFAYLKIGDILTFRNLHEIAAGYYERVLHFARDEKNPDMLWLLVNPVEASCRPAHIQFELLVRFVVITFSDPDMAEALRGIGKLYRELFIVPPEVLKSNLQILQNLLQKIPEGKRAEVLSYIANGYDTRIALLLIYLAPFSLSGLTSLAQQVTLRWVPAPRDDDLVIRFYHVLDSYGVPFEDSDWLFAQELIVEGLYIQAKSVLADLVKQRSTPDRLWLLAIAMWNRKDPVEEQIKVLYQFVTSTTLDDVRCGEAWKRIGDLSIENAYDCLMAVEVYKKADSYGYAIPQSEAFRVGNWDAIPALRNHPDYAFPPVVVLDLESDFMPEAPPGSRVFEIGAVRVKGSTELDIFHAIIRRDFVSPKVANKQEGAVELEQAIRSLQWFIGTSIVVGHNLQAFDAVHLRAMGLSICDDQIIDTLTFSRLLYPDSLHHHLGLLCQIHNIRFKGVAHTALADAQACADLLYALGDELIRRGDQLLSGFRAFIQPGSAFDRAVLQPRNVATDPDYAWELDPTPAPPHMLATINHAPASSRIIEALNSGRDALIERFDPNATYVEYLPSHQRSVVTVSTDSRLERILAAFQNTRDFYVLPDPQTLLCPHLLSRHIVQAKNVEVKLTLFCLYQASHNHDAQTLYPLRILSDDPAFVELRQELIESCCHNDRDHSDECSAGLAMRVAAERHRVLLSTHNSLVHQQFQPGGDVIIVDDIDELQMHFAELVTERITSQQVRNWSMPVFNLLDDQISSFVEEYTSETWYHVRIPLQSMVSLLIHPHEGNEEGLLACLEETDSIGKEIAQKLKKFCQKASQGANDPGDIHAYWLDLWFAQQSQEGSRVVEEWSFCGISQNLQQTFQKLFWEPYRQRIICGSAISLGALKTTFIKRFFGLPEAVVFSADERPVSQVYIPLSDDIRSASFLARISWAESIGAFLYRLGLTQRQSIIIALNESSIAGALAASFEPQRDQIHRQILSPHLNWTMAKIAERVVDASKSTMAFISPHQRRSFLDDPVDIEATGPLRFLNQRDPLVAAQLLVFDQRYKDEGSMQAYLLPQALLELKARISSPAKVHVILDSSLRAKVFRDEVFSLFREEELLSELPDLAEQIKDVSDVFLTMLSAELEQRGFTLHTKVSHKDLQMVLKSMWGADSFRTSPLNQEEVMQSIFAGKDQLVVAATGGGKSLCFQLPALLMAQDVVPKVTLVISPLIALMRDQVESLRRKGIFCAIVLDSMLSPPQQQACLFGINRGDYSIIYIAPEKFRSAALLRALKNREIGLIAFDEAHCVSQWGHNFRTDYFAVKKWVNKLFEGRQRSFPALALTATARIGHREHVNDSLSNEVSTVRDIIEKLGLQILEDEVVMTSPERPELIFRVEHVTPRCPDCSSALEMGTGMVKCSSCGKWYSFSKEDVWAAKFDALVSLLADQRETGLRQRWDRQNGIRQRGLVYCAYTETTKKVYEGLKKYLPDLRVGVYHGGKKITNEERQRVYQQFISDSKDGLDVVVATNAFGMGIDVRRLGFVIHFDTPATPEAYYQEAGRAGRDAKFRDGKDHAQCILLYHEHDLDDQRWLSSLNKFTIQQVEAVYEALNKLRSMGEKEILAPMRSIELLTGIEHDQIGTMLYYLENHTRVNGEYVLERGENGNHLWQIKFERGYQRLIGSSVLSPFSLQLIDIFFTSDQFGLSEGNTVLIDINELAAHLKWDVRQLTGEIAMLEKKHIVVRASRIYVNWMKSKSDICANISTLVSNLGDLLRHIEDQEALLSGMKVYINVAKFYEKSQLDVVPLNVFTHFLSCLARIDAGDLQLFEYFKPAYQFEQPGHYGLKLKPFDKIQQIFNNIGSQLCDVVGRFALDVVKDEWQLVDLLREMPDWEDRQRLKQQLNLLEVIELLEETKELESDLNIAMHISFEQDYITRDQLKIDLTSLRRTERYGERKLELMREYAMLPQEHRSHYFIRYFFGERPLVEPFEMHSDLTKQQQEIVALKGRYHLVEGPAGSGKTTVLLEHIRYLVECEFVPVDHILVVTHLNGAIDRISSDVEYLRKNNNVIKAVTLNALGEGIFRQHGQLLLRNYGLPYYAENAELKLLTGRWEKIQEQELILLGEVLARIQLEKWMQVPWPTDLDIPGCESVYGHSTDDEKQCLKAIHRLKSYGVFPTCSPDGESIRFVLKSLTTANYTASFYYAVYVDYLFLLGERGIYTYDDQILFALAILRTHTQIVRDYQRHYEHIIVDEFQDFMSAEAELVSVLSQEHQNVMVFGDDIQDIRPNNSKQAGTTLLDNFKVISGDNAPMYHYLKTNFRSVQEILNLANAVRNIGKYGKNEPQTAARSLRGEKPVAICVDVQSSNLSTRKNNDDFDDALLHVMVDTVLREVECLPLSDKGSVALMVAKQPMSNRVQRYLRYLNERKPVPFSVLGNTHRFQARYVDLVLSYFRLIDDKSREDDMEHILGRCFDTKQIRDLKKLAQLHDQSLVDITMDHDILAEIGIIQEQEVALLQHMNVLRNFSSESKFIDVWGIIRELPNGPIAAVAEQTNEKEELEDVLSELRKYTIRQALEYVDSHISFVEEHHSNRNLIITTVDHAKSQAFDTVFLLGADLLKERKRWYVSVSRAKQRFFFLVDGRSPEGWLSNPVLALIDDDLYNKREWP